MYLIKNVYKNEERELIANKRYYSFAWEKILDKNYSVK